ncbi:hypothetical protein ACFFMN_41715 [Planobispora siamensis]|uniref:Uncharacterized protein n=1 Tax=Planobispora siamensis TaxID=936338 RepID=A0A8J3WPP3_9ACTN|nr:hypothetical protein [Planobispora siamensis]GIH95912.1 hypothetical protein Psi01_65420 [Planobispora siamensis]
MHIGKIFSITALSVLVTALSAPMAVADSSPTPRPTCLATPLPTPNPTNPPTCSPTASPTASPTSYPTAGPVSPRPDVTFDPKPTQVPENFAALRASTGAMTASVRAA